jgi:hypothetical protein
MKRIVILLLLLTAGCSTAPIADLLDAVRPGRLGPGPYRGGVCHQHGPPAPPVAAPPPVVDAPPP